MTFDAVVVGGGPVGIVAALGLAAAGARTALIERRPPQPQPDNTLGVSARTVALSAASRQLLQSLDAWPSELLTPIQTMEVAEGRGTGVLSFSAADAGGAALAHMVEVEPWRAWLWPRLASGGIRVVSDALHGVREVGSNYVLSVGDVELSTSLLIAADGADSEVRKAFDVAMPLQPTGQSAVATAARVEIAHDGLAYQRFGTDGPLAFLPLRPAHVVSVVWSCSNDRAATLRGAATDDLARALVTASAGRLGAVTDVLEPAVFPLRQGVIADFCPRPGVVLIGDAARVIHPLAGQGVNLGFEDVAGMLRCLSAGRGWQRFARRRRARSQAAIWAMTALDGLYTAPQPAMLLLRNTVIRGLTSSRLGRRRLVAEAMGLGPLARAGQPAGRVT